MITIVMEIIQEIVTVFFMRQRWYLAVGYTVAFFALITATVLALINLGSLWLFSRDTAYNSLVTAAAAALIMIWWALFALARRTAG